MKAPEHPVLDHLADAITAVAGARERIPLAHLLRETALNILILTRIASNRLSVHHQREEIESAADYLVSQLRHAAWELPPPPAIAPPSPPDPSPPPPTPPLPPSARELAPRPSTGELALPPPPPPDHFAPLPTDPSAPEGRKSGGTRT